MNIHPPSQKNANFVILPVPPVLLLLHVPVVNPSMEWPIIWRPTAVYSAVLWESSVTFLISPANHVQMAVQHALEGRSPNALLALFILQLLISLNTTQIYVRSHALQINIKI